MKKFIIIAIILIVLVGGGAIFLRMRGGGDSQMAVLKVTSTPTATIFLDNQNLGKTPFEQKVKPGEYGLKLIPETTVSSLVSWEGKIQLSPNLLTFVNRDLGESELSSAGETLFLEKISGKEAELAILSTPDAASVTINSEDKGATPLVLSDLTVGSYDVTVSIDGFKSRTIKVKTTAGYKLTAQFQLAVSSDAQQTPEPSPSVDPSVKASPKASPKISPTPRVTPTPRASTEATTSASAKPKTSPPPKPYIEVLDTPTGFLNVRSESSTSADILTQIHPGEFYPLLDESGGWYKIEYEADKEGWVSSQYAEKFE